MAFYLILSTWVICRSNLFSISLFAALILRTDRNSIYLKLTVKFKPKLVFFFCSSTLKNSYVIKMKEQILAQTLAISYFSSSYSFVFFVYSEISHLTTHQMGYFG